MKRAAHLLLLVVAIAACSDEKPKPLSEPGETLYTVRGVIVSRSDADNSLHLDHEAIPGFMAAMKMDYTVRGAAVTTLPPDQSRIEAKLHKTSRGYWITDVKPIAKQASPDQ